MKIIDAVNLLHKNGFKNVELSGGLSYSDSTERDLIGLKTKYGLDYICHNYFPPAKEAFVLNLASLNDDIYRRTLRHLEKTIKLSKKLGAKKFGFHAGFFLDPEVRELGRDLSYRKLFDRDKCLRRFCEGFNILKKMAGDLELYLENHIVSKANLETFGNVTPFMLATYEEYERLRKMIDFKLLLDTGHLKVSSASFGLNYADELDEMIKASDYLHVSDNNGLADQHRHLSAIGDLSRQLVSYALEDKTITLETRGEMKNIKASYNLIEGVLK